MTSSPASLRIGSPLNFISWIARLVVALILLQTDSKPVEGNSRYTTEWNGAKWRFASDANLSVFKDDPEKYAPQFGGYCAWAVSRGYTASIDPASWKIVEGKLYLNYNAEVQTNWSKDIPGKIARGNSQWPKLIGK